MTQFNNVQKWTKLWQKKSDTFGGDDWRDDEGEFWGTDRILFLDLNIVYRGVLRL